MYVASVVNVVSAARQASSSTLAHAWEREESVMAMRLLTVKVGQIHDSASRRGV